MKRIGSYLRTVTILLFLLSLLAAFTSCSDERISPEDRDEILDHFRDRIYETLPITAETVYWTQNGTVYHLYRDCRFLSESAEVLHGTVAQSGRSTLCGVCAEKSEMIAYETEVGTGEAVLSGSDTVFSSESVSESVPETMITGTDSPETQMITSSDTDRYVTDPPPESLSPDTAPVDPPAVDVALPSVVYWTPNGSVWHADPGCSSLARSKVVNSGTVEQSGKSRGCKKCAP